MNTNSVYNLSICMIRSKWVENVILILSNLSDMKTRGGILSTIFVLGFDTSKGYRALEDN